MDKKKLSELAAEIARYVIEDGQVEGEDDEWWLTSLGAAVLFEADERGLEDATEIAEEAVRLYSKGKPGSSETKSQ
jgi:hypothetical protein